MLPADSVFEDLEARVVDLDGDARDEIMVVLSPTLAERSWGTSTARAA